MTDKYDEKTGPSEVDQSKNAHEVLDNSEDIEKKENSENHSKDIDKKLDRGEEIYTGFGFDNSRDNDNKLTDDLQTEKIDTIAVNKVANNSTDSKIVEKEIYKASTDESIVEDNNVKAVPVKAIEREDIKPSTSSKKNTTNNSTIVIKSDGKNIKSQNNKSKSAKAEDKVFYKDDIKNNYNESKKDNSTIVIKTNGNIKKDIEAPSKDKIVQDKERANYQDKVDSNYNDLSRERKSANYKEIPEDTKVVIKADNGDINYKENHIESGYNRVNKDSTLIENNDRYTRRNHKVLDFPVNESNVKGQVPADYQLKSTYYSNDSRPNTLYNTPGSVYKNYNTLSIKKHYKAKKKANRRGLSLKKVAIGVAAVAGIALILLPEDDDSSFRF